MLQFKVSLRIFNLTLSLFSFGSKQAPH